MSLYWCRRHSYRYCTGLYATCNRYSLLLRRRRNIVTEPESSPGKLRRQPVKCTSTKGCWVENETTVVKTNTSINYTLLQYYAHTSRRQRPENIAAIMASAICTQPTRPSCFATVRHNRPKQSRDKLNDSLSTSTTVNNRQPRGVLLRNAKHDLLSNFPIFAERGYWLCHSISSIRPSVCPWRPGTVIT